MNGNDYRDNGSLEDKGFEAVREYSKVIFRPQWFDGDLRQTSLHHEIVREIGIVKPQNAFGTTIYGEIEILVSKMMNQTARF